MKKVYTLILFLSLFPTINYAQIYEDDIFEIADSIGATINNVDAKAINMFFARDSFLNLVVKTKADLPEITAYQKEFLVGFSEKFDFGNIVLESVEDNYFDFINYYESVDNEVHLLFRLFDDESGGLNYYDFILTPIDDTLRIIDVLFYRSGERLSKSYNDIYKKVLRSHLDNESRGFFSKKENTDADRAVNIFEKVKAKYEEGKYQEAYDLYLTIPEEITKNKSFRLWKVNITVELGDLKKYRAAVEEYEKAYPDDPSLYIMAMDKYYMDGDFKNAIRCVDKLDIAVGLDDFLNYFRGNIYFEQKEYVKAQEKFEYITIEYPGFMGGWTNLVAAYEKTKAYSKMVEALTRLEDELEKEDIAQYMKIEYVDFCKTQAFKDWENAKGK